VAILLPRRAAVIPPLLKVVAILPLLRAVLLLPSLPHHLPSLVLLLVSLTSNPLPASWSLLSELLLFYKRVMDDTQTNSRRESEGWALWASSLSYSLLVLVKEFE
jgi:hypothetical protein